MILELGKKLKLARINNGLSRKQVAELTGVSIAMIGHYETGERTPSLSILIKLAAQYRVSLDYLLDNNLVSDSISLDGLTMKQKQVIKQTVECFRQLSFSIIGLFLLASSLTNILPFHFSKSPSKPHIF